MYVSIAPLASSFPPWFFFSSFFSNKGEAYIQRRAFGFSLPPNSVSVVVFACLCVLICVLVARVSHHHAASADALYRPACGAGHAAKEDADQRCRTEVEDVARRPSSTHRGEGCSVAAPPLRRGSRRRCAARTEAGGNRRGPTTEDASSGAGAAVVVVLLLFLLFGLRLKQRRQLLFRLRFVGLELRHLLCCLVLRGVD